MGKYRPPVRRKLPWVERPVGPRYWEGDLPKPTSSYWQPGTISADKDISAKGLVGSSSAQTYWKDLFMVLWAMYAWSGDGNIKKEMDDIQKKHLGEVKLPGYYDPEGLKEPGAAAPGVPASSDGRSGSALYPGKRPPGDWRSGKVYDPVTGRWFDIGSVPDVQITPMTTPSGVYPGKFPPGYRPGLGPGGVHRSGGVRPFKSYVTTKW